MNITVKDQDGVPFDFVYLDKSPKADFDVVGAAAGPAPLEVQFKDLSTGHRSNYRWDFGDGTITTSRAVSQTHEYKEWGYYTVALTVSTTLMSDTMTKPDLVRVGYDADFSANPTTGPLPLIVNFDPLEPDTEYCYWDFGDGVKLQNCGTVSHTYKENGMFTVVHTVGNDSGDRTTMTKPDYIKVEPYADWTYRAEWVPFAIWFSDASRGDAVTSYHWDFGDGGTSTEQNPQHLYVVKLPAVTYSVVLNVTFANGLTDSRRREVTIPVPDYEPSSAYLPAIFRGDEIQAR